MREFLARKKEWFILVGIFLLSRFVVFSSFWQASKNLGVWENFYRQTDWWLNAMFRDSFIPYCDGQPPLYASFTTFARLFHDSYTMLVFTQLITSFVALVFVYKIAKLFLNKNLAFLATAFMAFEPYRAWFDFLFSSEALYTPLFFGALYYFFLYYRSKQAKFLYISAVIFVLASLTRSNSFLLPQALSIGLVAYYFLNKYYLRQDFFAFKKLFISIIIFNLIYVTGLAPWMIRHHSLYGQYSLATIFSCNIYFYNAPELLGKVNNTSFAVEKRLLYKKAEEKFDVVIKDYADCGQYDSETYKQMLEYFKTEGNKIISENKYAYAKIHLFKALPFFLKSGYMQMYGAYTGDYTKPNISSAVLEKDLESLFGFIKSNGLKFWIFLLGTIFWGLCSLAVLANLVWGFFRRDKYLFYYAVIFGILVYSALVVSPFMVPRYTLPTAPLFVVSLVVFVKNLYSLSSWGREAEPGIQELTK